MSRSPRGRAGGPASVKWDPARQTPLLADPDHAAPFNPLDTKNIAIAVAKALLDRNAKPLGALTQFRGAGIYAIYYSGKFRAYRALAKENRDKEHPRWPIYVGKATPAGGRRGGPFNLEATDTTALFGRLREHAESIRSADNIAIEDFTCRFLVIQHLWIPLAESLLISHFAPIWNRLVDGFGNHDPGGGRYNSLCPRWDVLHPGRDWAAKCKPRPEQPTDIEREVVTYLASAPIPSLATLAGNISAK
ncbi:MAG: Eco29kI family restriction endonuclease [Acetobacteraceae bacterium]